MNISLSHGYYLRLTLKEVGLRFRLETASRVFDVPIGFRRILRAFGFRRFA